MYLASCPIDSNGCGAVAPGWYSGLYPALAGAVTYGLVCFNDNGNVCDTSIPILVTNCNGFYIYHLQDPLASNQRYCTN